jgi:putative transposase
MGRVGACGDNAARVLLRTVATQRPGPATVGHTRAELRLAIVTWIERTHHRRRRQRALGKLTPMEFELLHTPVAAAA